MLSQNIFDKKRDKIERKKLTFITKELDLSSEELSTSFLPIYNSYSDKKEELNKKRIKEFNKMEENRSSLQKKKLVI